MIRSDKAAARLACRGGETLRKVSDSWRLVPKSPFPSPRLRHGDEKGSLKTRVEHEMCRPLGRRQLVSPLTPEELRVDA